MSFFSIYTGFAFGALSTHSHVCLCLCVCLCQSKNASKIYQFCGQNFSQASPLSSLPTFALPHGLSHSKGGMAERARSPSPFFSLLILLLLPSKAPAHKKMPHRPTSSHLFFLFFFFSPSSASSSSPFPSSQKSALKRQHNGTGRLWAWCGMCVCVRRLAQATSSSSPPPLLVCVPLA